MVNAVTDSSNEGVGTVPIVVVWTMSHICLTLIIFKSSNSKFLKIQQLSCTNIVKCGAAINEHLNFWIWVWKLPVTTKRGCNALRTMYFNRCMQFTATKLVCNLPNSWEQPRNAPSWSLSTNSLIKLTQSLSAYVTRTFQYNYSLRSVLVLVRAKHKISLVICLPLVARWLCQPPENGIVCPLPESPALSLSILCHPFIWLWPFMDRCMPW